MAEQDQGYPEVPPSEEVLIYEVTHEAVMNAAEPLEKYVGEENVGNLFDRAKQRIKAAGKAINNAFWNWEPEREIADYLSPTDEDYIFAEQYIRKRFGNPQSEDEFIRLLEDHISEIEQASDAQDFENRLAVIAYQQGQKERLQLSHEALHKNGMFETKDRRPEIAQLRATRPVIRQQDKIRLRITRSQAQRLRATEESRTRIAVDQAFDSIIDQMDSTGEVA